MRFNLRLSRNRAAAAEPLVAPAPHAAPAEEARSFRSLASLVPTTRAEDLVPAFLGPTPADWSGPLDGAARREARLRDVFTPTQPRMLGPLFIGREAYLRRLIAAIEEERAHVVLFADRGRGKTSLANAVSHLAQQVGYVVLRRACGSSVSFEELFRGLLAELPPRLLEANPALGRLLGNGGFGAARLTDALAQLRGGHLILLIDEFDRLQSERTRTEVAEAIKNLSDARAPVSFLIVGVARSLDDLIGRHPSIQRNILGLHLAPMQPAEVRRVIVAGAAAAQIAFTEAVVRAIVCFARGMPYYAHLLCLLAGRAAMARQSGEVILPDLEQAVAEALRKQPPEFDQLYARATAALPAAEDVLFAAATASADEHSRFTAGAVAAAGGLQPELAEPALALLSAGERGPVLQRFETAAGARHGFADPGFAHYILFRQAGRRGLLDGSRP